MRTQVRCLTDPVYRTPVYVSFSNREQSSYREVLSSRHTFFFLTRRLHSSGINCFPCSIIFQTKRGRVVKKRKGGCSKFCSKMIHELITKDGNLFNLIYSPIFKVDSSRRTTLILKKIFFYIITRLKRILNIRNKGFIIRN